MPAPMAPSQNLVRVLDRGVDGIAQDRDLVLHRQSRHGDAVLHVQVLDEIAQGLADGGRMLHQAADDAERRERRLAADEEAEMRAVRRLKAKPEQPAQGGGGNDVVGVVEEPRIESGGGDHGLRVTAEVPQHRPDFAGDAEIDEARADAADGRQSGLVAVVRKLAGPRTGLAPSPLHRLTLRQGYCLRRLEGTIRVFPDARAASLRPLGTFRYVIMNVVAGRESRRDPLSQR